MLDVAFYLFKKIFILFHLLHLNRLKFMHYRCLALFYTCDLVENLEVSNKYVSNKFYFKVILNVLYKPFVYF